jgi:hypothetical protein
MWEFGCAHSTGSLPSTVTVGRYLSTIAMAIFAAGFVPGFGSGGDSGLVARRFLRALIGVGELLVMCPPKWR